MEKELWQINLHLSLMEVKFMVLMSQQPKI